MGWFAWDRLSWENQTLINSVAGTVKGMCTSSSVYFLSPAELKG